MNASEETVYDIADEMSAYGTLPPPRFAWIDLAERIKSAYKRDIDKLKSDCNDALDEEHSREVADMRRRLSKANETTDEIRRLANYLWTKIPITTERNSCVLDEEATRLRNIAVLHDNINVIAELQRRLWFAEEGADNTISGDDAEEIQRHLTAIREILKKKGAKDGK